MKKCKSRWFVADVGCSFSSFIADLKRNIFSESEGYGFEIYQSDRDYAEFKFIEKNEKIELSKDQFNNDYVSKYYVYSSFFIKLTKIRNNLILFEIKNPPASMKKFINVINDITDFDFSTKKIEFDIKDAYKFFTSKKFTSRFHIPRVSIRDMYFDATSFANSEIISSKNAYLEVQKNFKGNKFIFDKIQISLRYQDSDAFIEIARSGLISYSENIESAIERYIAKIIL